MQLPLIGIFAYCEETEDLETPVPSSPQRLPPAQQAPEPAPFLGWGWGLASELMPMVEPFLRRNEMTQNIPGEGALEEPAQAEAPAEVPNPDLEPAAESESEDESSSSLEEDRGDSGGGKFGGCGRS